MVVEVVSSRQEKVGLEGKMEGCQHLLKCFQGSQKIISQRKFECYLQVGRKVVGQAEAKMVEEELRFGQPADHQGQCCHHHQKQWY